MMFICSLYWRAGGKKSNRHIAVTLFMLLLAQGARFERERPLGLPLSPRGDYRLAMTLWGHHLSAVVGGNLPHQSSAAALF